MGERERQREREYQERGRRKREGNTESNRERRERERERERESKNENSLDPRPSSPPDLRPSGRGPGKTAILFGEIRTTSSIFSRFRKSFTCGRGAHNQSLLKVIADISCCKSSAGVAPCSCHEQLLARSMWPVVVCGVFASFRFTETRPQLEGNWERLSCMVRVFCSSEWLAVMTNQSRAFRSWCIVWRGNDIVVEQCKEIRSSCFWCGAVPLPNRRKIFFQSIAIIVILGVLLVSFSAGHAVGEGRSALQRSLPDLRAAYGSDIGESAGTTWRERSLLCSAKNVCGAWLHPFCRPAR